MGGEEGKSRMPKTVPIGREQNTKRATESRTAAEHRGGGRRRTIRIKSQWRFFMQYIANNTAPGVRSRVQNKAGYGVWSFLASWAACCGSYCSLCSSRLRRACVEAVVPSARSFALTSRLFALFFLCSPWSVRARPRSPPLPTMGTCMSCACLPASETSQMRPISINQLVV